MTGQSLDLRLVSSPRLPNLDEVWGQWRSTTISVNLPAMSRFADAPSLVNKLRGALGAELLRSASARVKQREPCTFPTTSAAEVLFGARPHLLLFGQRHEIAKPYVLWAQKGPNESLSLRCRLFGLATDLRLVVAGALVAAIQNVPWRILQRDVAAFLPARLDPTDLVISPDRLHRGAAPRSARLEFLSALDVDRGDPTVEPRLLLNRMMRRAAAISLWQGADIVEPIEGLDLAAIAINTCDPATTGLRFGGHRRLNKLRVAPAFHLQGELGPFWPVLVVAELAHVGRGAVVGAGRFRLIAEQDET